MQYVFSTKNPTRYVFPTHINDLVIDRSETDTSEVFLVVIEPGSAPPLHIHKETEQIFYILEGQGVLEVGNNKATNHTETVYPGEVVRIPPRTYHTIHCQGGQILKYLAIDCFVEGKPKAEPTWDSHVKVLCNEQGWDYSQVKK
ncbi:MAG: cupin domain-containing protein [Promethearchaeota archaeon]